MKTILSLILISFSFSVSAADHACSALIQELGIPAATQGEAMRKFTLSGTTKDEEECEVKFLPEFCTFELGAPLETPEMYYLKDTSYSSIKISFREGDKFSFKAVTKESTDNWGKVTRTLKIERAPKAGYELSYYVKEGRIFKDDARSFKCNVSVARN